MTTNITAADIVNALGAKEIEKDNDASSKLSEATLDVRQILHSTAGRKLAEQRRTNKIDTKTYFIEFAKLMNELQSDE